MKDDGFCKELYAAWGPAYFILPANQNSAELFFCLMYKVVRETIDLNDDKFATIKAICEYAEKRLSELQAETPIEKPA